MKIIIKSQNLQINAILYYNYTWNYYLCIQIYLVLKFCEINIFWKIIKFMTMKLII